MQRERPGPTVTQTQPELAPFAVRDWVAQQLACAPGELRPMRAIDLAPGVREVRYLRIGQLAGAASVVATVARQQPGRYRIRATWPGGGVETSVRGRRIVD